jgi:hypothetical protein
MSEAHRTPALTSHRDAVELGNGRRRAEGDRASVERYLRSRIQARTGRPERGDRPRPLEFDESGFPIAQRSPKFVDRVARLLRP